MSRKQVLIGGGYGSVGSHITALISKTTGMIPVVAGRDGEKAKALAQKFGCRWKTVDLTNKNSIENALKNIDIVINCYIPSDDFTTSLPEKAAKSGIHYLDIAAFNNYNERVVDLNKIAAKNNAVLVTGLGLYPGMPGLILAGNKEFFDKIDSVDIYFTSGGKMEGLSALSLQGISQMMNVAPLVWNGDKWVKPVNRGTREYIAEPFNRKISFFPFMITHDLIMLPGIMESGKIAMWSGTESVFQGMVFLVGMKLGFAKKMKKAKKFIRVLRFLGKNKNEDYSMKIVTRGIKDNMIFERVVEMNAPEELLTAGVAGIICEQISDGHIKKAGAFTGPEVVNAQKFSESLKAMDIHYKESFNLIQ